MHGKQSAEILMFFLYDKQPWYEAITHFKDYWEGNSIILMTFCGVSAQ